VVLRAKIFHLACLVAPESVNLERRHQADPAIHHVADRMPWLESTLLLGLPTLREAKKRARQLSQR
jgi:hypothetical protein